MKRNARNAYKALEKLGAPIYDRQEYGAHFILGGELRDRDDNYFADYWQEELREHLRDVKPGEDTTNLRIINGRVCENPFGIRTDVDAILTKYGLYAEWINGGMCGIYDA